MEKSKSQLNKFLQVRTGESWPREEKQLLGVELSSVCELVHLFLSVLTDQTGSSDIFLFCN